MEGVIRVVIVVNCAIERDGRPKYHREGERGNKNWVFWVAVVEDEYK